MLLTNAIHSINLKNERLSNVYVVTEINSTKALVSRDGCMDERTVEFRPDGGFCSCTEWQQMQYPCRHAIAANRILEFKTDVKEWYEYAFNHIYLLSNYKRAYSNPDITPPTLHGLMPEDEAGGIQRLRPSRYKTTKRPRKKRIRKRRETEDGGPVKVYKCSICGSTEHNVRRCSNNYNDI